MLNEFLFMKSIRDHLRSVIGWVSGITLLVVIQLSVYPTVRASSKNWSDLTDSFPEAFKKMFRMTDYASEAGYIATELLSFLVPFIFIGLGCTWGARATTEEEERGTADVLLSLPVTRRSIVTTRLASATWVLVTAGVLFGTTLTIGARMLDMSIAVDKFVAASVCLTLLGFLMMTIAAAIGARTGKRAMALGYSMSVAIASFILYSLAPLVKFLEPTARFTPMQWTIGSDPVHSGVDLPYTAWLLVVAGVFIAATYLAFDRRDISG